MDHYEISLDDVLSIPVETIQEQIIDYLIKNKSYMAKRAKRMNPQRSYDFITFITFVNTKDFFEINSVAASVEQWSHLFFPDPNSQ